MIPYNPSSFDRNKTILEQILELKKWLKEHPSYKAYTTYTHYYPTQNRDIFFNEINGDTDFVDSIAIGDIVVWGDGYFSSVEAVTIDPDDRDNSYVTMAIPVTSLIGPQGPAGTSVTNATVTAGYLTLYLSDGSQILCGYVKGADGTNGTNGTNGTDGKYISNVTVDGNGDLICTIYDPETSTSTQVNAGYVVGPAGQDGHGMSIINTTTLTGTLSASDLAKANGTDDCILIYTDNGVDLTMQRIMRDSSNVYFYSHFIDTGKAVCSICEVNAVTGAYTISGGDLPIKASNIDSETATNGQVLTADGLGGASWQTPGGGSTLYEHNIMIQENNFNWTARLQIISNSDTQITDKSTLRVFLSDNGFSSINNYFLGTGSYRYGGVVYLVLGLFSNSGTNLSFSVLDTSFILSQQNFWLVNVTITDIVRTL